MDLPVPPPPPHVPSAAPDPTTRVPARMRCAACRASVPLSPVAFPLAPEGHRVRAVHVAAVGTCRRCVRAVPPAPPPDEGPLAQASLRSVRLLLGHVLLTRPEALEEAGLLPPGASRPACAALFRGVAAVAAGAAGRRLLDAVLERELGEEARRFRDLPLCALAEELARAGAHGSRRTLHALLWSVARRPEVAFRKLEPRVAARIEARRAPEDACPSRRHD